MKGYPEMYFTYRELNPYTHYNSKVFDKKRGRTVDVNPFPNVQNFLLNEIIHSWVRDLDTFNSIVTPPEYTPAQNAIIIHKTEFGTPGLIN